MPTHVIIKLWVRAPLDCFGLTVSLFLLISRYNPRNDEHPGKQTSLRRPKVCSKRHCEDQRDEAIASGWLSFFFYWYRVTTLAMTSIRESKCHCEDRRSVANVIARTNGTKQLLRVDCLSFFIDIALQPSQWRAPGKANVIANPGPGLLLENA
jgi:hypothetical protein